MLAEDFYLQPTYISAGIVTRKLKLNGSLNKHVDINLLHLTEEDRGLRKELNDNEISATNYHDLLSNSVSDGQ